MSERVIHVVAAVVQQQGRYLITQRRPGAVLPLLWEFPGGKVEPGETDEDALHRELMERLGVQGEIDGKVGEHFHAYEGYDVHLTLYAVHIPPAQTPTARRVNDFRWVCSSEFDQYRFPDADQATMDQLLSVRR